MRKNRTEHRPHQAHGGGGGGGKKEERTGPQLRVLLRQSMTTQTTQWHYILVIHVYMDPQGEGGTNQRQGRVQGQIRTCIFSALGCGKARKGPVVGNKRA